MSIGNVLEYLGEMGRCDRACYWSLLFELKSTLGNDYVD